MGAGRNKAAAVFLTKAIEGDPTDISSRENLAAAYVHLKQYDEALANYERALRIQNETLVPGHWSTVRTHSRLGRLLLTLKRRDEAEPHLRAAAEGKTEFRGRVLPMAEHKRHYGALLIDLKRFDEAHAVLMEALEIASRPELDGGIIVTRIAGNLQKLFTAWSKPEEAARWREQYEQRRAAEQAATEKPSSEGATDQSTTGP